MAIRVMLESFIGTQKTAVRRSLEKHFKKYMTFKRDSFELLLYVLQQLVQEELTMKHLRAHSKRGPAQEVKLDEPIEITIEDFQAKAAELQISDLHPFYRSDLFRKNGFELDQRSKKIIKRDSMEWNVV